MHGHERRAAKAPQNDQLIVVPYRPRRKLWMLLITLLGYSVVAIGSYYGAQLVVQQRSMVPASLLVVQPPAEVAELEASIAQLEEQIAIYQQNGKVERQAIELVRQENKQLLDQISGLEEQVAYYKRVMNTDKRDKGLVIGKMLIKSTTEPMRFRYNFNLIQVSGSSRVGGKVFVTLLGVEYGQKREIPLKELSDSVDNIGIKVGFHNFQSIQGELVITDGFQPEQVEIIAQFDSGKSVRLRKVYDWAVQETLSDVGKG